MKVQIREGVFETNSSSTHSITICTDGALMGKAPTDFDNRITATGRYFSAGPYIYRDFKDKLGYLIAIIFRECRTMEQAVAKKTDYRYQMLEKVVRDHTGSDLNVMPDPCLGPIFGDVHDEDASRQLFEDENKLSAFLFNPQSYMKTMPLGWGEEWPDLPDLEA